jgi:hypothetical protein
MTENYTGKMEERQAFLHVQPFPVDDASTIGISSIRSTSTKADQSAVSYDSLTYSSASDDGDRYFQYRHNQSTRPGSSASVSLISYGNSTVLSSEQLIQNLQKQRSGQLPPSPQQQCQRHQGLQPLTSLAGISPMYHKSNNNRNSNVYHPRSVIGNVFHGGDSTATVTTLGNNGSPCNPQELLLPPYHSRSIRSCLTSPRVLFTVVVCGIILFNLILGNSHLIEQWWEMGCEGMAAQRTAHSAQANLVSMATLKTLKLPQATVVDDRGAKMHVEGSAAAAAATTTTGSSNVEKKNSASNMDGCEATIMLIRHCEKGGLKSHCSFMGFERSVYLATLFGDDKQWPAPSQIYALSKDRTHKWNYREVETVQAVSDTVGVAINRDYSTLDTKALSHDLLGQLQDGDLCGKLVLVSWKHSDIPKLAQHLGCGPLQGCPWDYKGKDFDSTWQIR